MSQYIVNCTFKIINGSTQELSSDIVNSKEAAETLARILRSKMGFSCEVVAYDSEPTEAPYGSYPNEH